MFTPSLLVPTPLLDLPTPMQLAPITEPLSPPTAPKSTRKKKQSFPSTNDDDIDAACPYTPNIPHAVITDFSDIPVEGLPLPSGMVLTKTDFEFAIRHFHRVRKAKQRAAARARLAALPQPVRSGSPDFQPPKVYKTSEQKRRSVAIATALRKNPSLITREPYDQSKAQTGKKRGPYKKRVTPPPQSPPFPPMPEPHPNSRFQSQAQSGRGPLPPFKPNIEYINDMTTNTVMIEDDVPPIVQDDIPPPYKGPWEPLDTYEEELQSFLEDEDWKSDLANRRRFNANQKVWCLDLNDALTDEVLYAIVEETTRHKSQPQSSTTLADMDNPAAQFSFPNTIVHEYDQVFNLSLDRDLRNYLRHVMEHFRQIPKPRNQQVCKVRAQTYIKDKTHRYAALRTLAYVGIPLAKLYYQCYTDTLTVAYDDFSLSEPQNDLLIGVLMTLFSIVMICTFNPTARQAIVQKYTSFTQPLSTTFTDLSSVITKLKQAVDSVDQTITVVKGWVQTMYNHLKSLFQKVHRPIFFILKIIIVSIITTLVCETIKTYAPSFFHAILDFLVEFLKLPLRIKGWFQSRPQASVSVLPEMLQTMFEFIAGETSFFMKVLGPLPKIVSIAKAIEWIFSNLNHLVTSIIEAMTGELRGRNAAESAMLEFITDVAVFKDRVKKTNSQDLVSSDLAAHCKRLTDTSVRLQMKAIHSNSQLRNVVATSFNVAAKDLTTAVLAYSTRLSAGEPRPIPVVVYVYGPPGIGKSAIFMQWISDMWATVVANQDPANPVFIVPEFGYDQLYSMTHGELYHDGYEQHPIVLIDDFFQMKDPKERSNVAATFVNMVSPTPYPLLVADMERKSHVFFTSRLIFCTSNLSIDKLHGSSAGLQDVNALISRINLGFEMIDNDHFKLHTAAVSLDGTPPMLGVTCNYSQVVSLTAAAILTRHAELSVKIKPTIQPLFQGLFVSDRLKIGAHGKVPDYPKFQKGKEKESDDDLPGPSLTPPSPPSNPDHLADARIDYFSEEELEKRSHPSISLFDLFQGIESKAQALTPADIVNGLHTLCCSTKNREAQLCGRLSPHIVSWVDKFYPQLAYPTPYDLDAAGHLQLNPFQQPLMLTYPNWCASPGMVHYLQNHATPPPALDYLHFQASAHTMSAAQYLFLGAAAVGVVAVAAFMFIRAFIPSSAHEESTSQSFSYDNYSKGGKGRPHKHNRQIKQTQRVPTHRSAARPSINDAYLSSAQGDTDTLRTVLAQNFCHVAVRAYEKGKVWTQSCLEDSPKSSSWGLFIRGDYLMIPHHTVFGYVDLPTEEVFVTIGHQSTRHTFNIDELKSPTGPRLWRIRGDVSVIQVPHIRYRRDITGHFADGIPSYGEIQQILPSFNHTGTDTKVARSWKNNVRAFPVNEEYGNISSDIDFEGVPNKTGDCGGVFAHIDSAKIIAFHIGGCPYTLTAHGTQIFKQDFDLLPQAPQIEDPINYLLTEPIAGPPPPPSQAQSSGPMLVTPTGHYPGVDVIGLVPRGKATWSPSHTRLKRSTFSYDPGSFPFLQSDREPAMLSRTDVDGVEVNPLANVFRNKLGTIYRPPGPGQLDNLDGFLPSTFNRENVRVIGLGEALFGIPFFLAPMDRHASIGYLFKQMGFQNRGQLFGPPPNDPQDISGVHPLLVRLVEQKMAVFKSGRISPAIFEGFLKDELRPKAKVDQGSTRLIDPMDLVSLIVQRMVLGTFIEECMKDPVNCPITLGINVHSSQWGKLYLRHLGPELTRILLAGDFEVFDYHGLNEQLADFIRLVRMVHPLPDLAELVIRANFVAWHIIGRLLFLRPAGTCSGSLITALYNCFVNFWIHKKAFLALYPEEDFPHLLMNFVGDDSLCSVPPECALFTMQHIADWAMKWIGIRYTAPDKSSDMFVTPETLMFLKRTFKNSPFGYLAPLAEGSITDMIKWTESPGDEAIMASTIQSFLLESWHYGEKRYSAAFQWAKRALASTPCYLPDWHEMVAARQPDYAVAFG